MATICDPCRDAAYDEGSTDPEEQILVCYDLGADIADHSCDWFDDPSVYCRCACHPAKRTPLAPITHRAPR